jgi:hypothetical protein
VYLSFSRLCENCNLLYITNNSTAMSLLPAALSSAVGSNDMRAPPGMSSLGGVGMPSLSMTGNSNGPSASSTQAILNGLNMSGMQMNATHVGQHTSSAAAIGNPRLQVQNTYVIDMLKTSVHEIGNYELHFIDLESGTPGVEGQDKPYAFKSLSAMNCWLWQEAQRKKYGGEKSTAWFNKRFKLAGVVVHEDTHDRAHLDSARIHQVMTFTGHCKVYDLFQGYDPSAAKNSKNRSSLGNSKSLGANVNDYLFLVLRSFPYESSLDRDLPSVAGNREPTQRYWQLCPMYSEFNRYPDVSFTHSFTEKGVIAGESYKIGRVLHIYDAPGDVVSARKAAYNRSMDGRHKEHFFRLRKLDVQLNFV